MSCTSSSGGSNTSTSDSDLTSLTSPDSPPLLDKTLPSRVYPLLEELLTSLPLSASDEIAKNLVAAAKDDFNSARALYYAGNQGPFTLPGTYSEATFEALCTVLESKWRLGWYQGSITFYGDPGDLHELAVERIATDIKSAALSWIGKHADAPDQFRDLEGLQELLQDYRSAGRKWLLTESSTTLFVKEPDSFFRATKTNAVECEDGVVVEIAHGNEELPELLREIVDWTRGVGDRALMAIGLKIDTKSPHQREPFLRLIVRNVSPSTTSINVFMYSFGAGSGIPARSTRDRGPASTASIADSTAVLAVEQAFLHRMIPDDSTAPFVIDIPIGEAIFHDIKPDSFPGVPLTPEFILHLKKMIWKIDLGYLRYRLTEIVQSFASN